MSHGKRTGITIILSIFIGLMGLLGSIGGGLRYAMSDRAIETLAQEWELSQMLIDDIAADYTMAQFLMIMMDTPGIDAEGTKNLIESDYTKDFIAAKIRDYRDDFLNNTGNGKVYFAELVKLEEENRDAVCRDLMYSISAADLEQYEAYWNNLALTDHSDLSWYRSDNAVLFSLARVMVSGWFLAVLLVLCVPGAAAVFWYLYGHNFKGYGVYGITLAVVGAIDCIGALLCGNLASLINRVMKIQSNLMTLVFTPVANMLLIVGVVSILLGIIAFALRILTENRR